MSEQQAQHNTVECPGIFARLSQRQQKTLREIATGHITTVTYESGPSYWGPTLVFANDDLAALRAKGLIDSEGIPRVAAAGIEALGGVLNV